MAELLTGFPKGNIEKYAALLQSQTPKTAALLLKTIDPLVCACLIELLGSSSRFQKTSGMLMPRMASNGVNAFEVRLIYRVPDFVGFGGKNEAIQQDQSFILSRLQQVPGIKWESTSVRIMPNDGSVTIMFDMPIDLGK